MIIKVGFKLLIVLLSSACLLPGAMANEAQAPNIVIILTDDLGCGELKLSCELVYRGAKQAVHKDATAYLIATLN